MQETIVQFLSERGTLIQPEALDYLSNLPEPVSQLKQGLRRGHEIPFVLTLDHARTLTTGPGTQAPEEPKTLPEPNEKEAPKPSENGQPGPVAPTQDPEPDTQPDTEADPADPPNAKPEPREPPGKPANASTTTDNGSESRQQPPRPSSNLSPQARAVIENVKVELDITGESTCEGQIEDFTKLFRDRYNRMAQLLRKNRRELYGATTIADLSPGEEKKVIGLVKDVKTTKNGHRIIELEDDTGETVILAPEDNDRLIELSDTLLVDEVVGIVGKKLPDRGSKDGLLVMEELVRLDMRLEPTEKQGMPGSAVFVSDVHLGADTFLHDPWDEFIDWLADRTATHPDEDGVKYLVIAGDLVEGVGVYPGQEDILHIPDVYDQYEHAANTLNRLPEDLHIIIQPGNHDTVVRLAEPQPALPEPVQGFFGENVRFVGNPSRISFNDIELLSYHGVSLFDYFEALPQCTIDRPVHTMEEMLRRRHLCPPYGGKTPLAPEHRDHLVVETEPDIFVTGHVHAARTGEYRGTRLINASTWQAQTDYQRMRGFDPDPCKAFEVDLSTLGVTTWSFDHEHDTGTITIDQTDVSRQKIGAIAE